MKTMLLCLACALLASCDYTVPLVRKPEAAMDTAVVGLWQKPGDGGKTENLLVLPLSKQEVLVVFPAGASNAMFAKGCLWRSAAATLVQLDWFGTAQGKMPEDDRTFQFVSYTVQGDVLRLRLLNPDVVAKDIRSSEALAKAIFDSHDNPRLYRDEMVFHKVKE